MAVVWFQCATCCEAGWRRFLGRRARTPPPTCRAFATPWRFRIWRHVGTTGSDGRAVSSTSTRTPPPSPRYVHRIIPSSGRSSRRDPPLFCVSRWVMSATREKRGRVLTRVSQIALIPRVDFLSSLSMKLVRYFVLSSVIFDYDYSYLCFRIVCKFWNLQNSGSWKMGQVFKGDMEKGGIFENGTVVVS